MDQAETPEEESPEAAQGLGHEPGALAVGGPDPSEPASAGAPAAESVPYADEPIAPLLLSEEPCFERDSDLGAALLQFQQLLPPGLSATVTQRGVSRRNLGMFLIVAFPAFVILGALTAGIAAGLSTFLGSPTALTRGEGVGVLGVDLLSCFVIIYSASPIAGWAARITSCWNRLAVAGVTGLGAFSVASAVFLPLFGPQSIAPTEAWIGDFDIRWPIIAMALVLTPCLAALLAVGKVEDGRVCPDTGQLLRPELKIRFPIPEGLAAYRAIREERLGDLTELASAEPSTRNVVEFTVYADEGAERSFLELEAQFWAELGPPNAPGPTQSRQRKTLQWLVLSTTVDTAKVLELFAMNWRATPEQG
ncbi:MAG: hypothetical protein VX498_15345 [Myxococcota bacterium]|nr:hypothetical protein [Myxococcota bacterium]